MLIDSDEWNPPARLQAKQRDARQGKSDDITGFLATGSSEMTPT